VRPGPAVLVLLSNALLLFLVQLTNSMLSWTGLYVYLGGLYVLFSASFCHWRSGLLAVLATGLLYDAMHPVPFGLSMALLGFAYLVALRVSPQIDPHSPLHFVLVGLVLNALLFLAMTLTLGRGYLGNGAYWAQAGLDFLASAVAVALVGHWFHGFQRLLFRLTGAPMEKPK